MINIILHDFVSDFFKNNYNFKFVNFNFSSRENYITHKLTTRDNFLPTGSR